MNDPTQWRDVDPLAPIQAGPAAPVVEGDSTEWADVEPRIAPVVQPSRPEVVDTLIKTAPDPEKMKKQVSTALALKAETGLSWPDVFVKSKVLVESKTPEVKKLGEAIVDSARMKIVSNRIGQIGYKMMFATSPEEHEALLEEAKKLEAELPKYEDVEPAFPPGVGGRLRKWGRKALTGSAGFLAQQLDLMIGKGAKDKVEAMGKKEEPFQDITDMFSFTTWMLNTLVPKNFRDAFAIGTNPVMAMGEVEGGSAYIDLIKAGVDPAIAKPFAYGIGQINNVLEMASVASLVSKFPGAKKVVQTAMDKMLDRVLAGSGLGKAIARAGVKMVTGPLEQLGQEYLQEASTFFGENLTMALNDAVKGTDLERNEDFMGRLKEITKEAGPAFFLMQGIPGAANVAAGIAAKASSDLAAKKATLEQVNPALKAAEARMPAAVRQARSILEQPIEERDEAAIAAARRALDQTINAAVESPSADTVSAAVKAADLADQMDRETEEGNVRPETGEAEAAAAAGEPSLAANRGAYRQEPWDLGRGSEGVGTGNLVGDAVDPEVVARAWAPTYQARQSLSQSRVATEPVLELNPQSGAAQFHEAISKAREEHKFGASVYVYPEEEYSGMRLFLSPDKKTGAALKPDGDFVSGFNTNNRKGVSSVGGFLVVGVENGAKKLDCFNTVLPDLYADYGFVPVARTKWDDQFAPPGWDKETFKKFNNGEPDVVFMVYAGGERATLAERIGTFPEVDINSIPYSESYEAGQAAQLKAIEDISRREKLEAVARARQKNQVQQAVELGIPVDDAALIALADKDWAREEIAYRDEVRDLAIDLEDEGEVVDVDEFVEYMQQSEIEGLQRTREWYEQQWENKEARRAVVSKERDDAFVENLEIGDVQNTLREIAANPNAEIGKLIAPFVRKSRGGITEADFQDFVRVAAKNPRKVRAQIEAGLDPDGKTAAAARRLEEVASKATRIANADKSLDAFEGTTISALSKKSEDPAARKAARRVATLARAAMKPPSPAVWHTQRREIRDLQATVTLERGPKAREIRQRLRDFYEAHPELTPDAETQVILNERFIGDLKVGEFREFADKVDQARRVGMDLKKMDDLKEAKLVEEIRQGILKDLATNQRFEKGVNPYEMMSARKRFVRRMVALIPGSTKESVLSVMPLVDMYARAEGKSTGRWIKDHIAEVTERDVGPAETGVLEQESSDAQAMAKDWLGKNPEPPLSGTRYINKPGGKKDRSFGKLQKATILEGDARKLWEAMGMDPEEALALDNNGEFKNPDLADRVLDIMTDSLVYETMSALSKDGSALGWYDRTVTKAFETLVKVHPEVMSDPDSMKQFKLALATTSQGTKVEENFVNAHYVYEYFKENGKWPGWVAFGGKDKGSIAGNLVKLQGLYDKYGVRKIHDFLDQQYTVREVEKAFDLKISGENKDTLVYGSVILGPKIGGAFYQNLNRNFDPLTMDMWFSRTVGRTKGKLFRYDEHHMRHSVLPTVRDAILEDPDLTAKERDAWLPLVDKLLDLPEGELTREAAQESEFAKIAKAIHKKYQKSSDATNATYADKTDLNKAMKTADLWIHQVRDLPTSGGERNLWRKIINDVRAKLREQGIDLNVADTQAILWYSEKDVFASFGKTDPNDPDYDASEEEDDGGRRDYAQAADRLVRAIERNELLTGQVGEARPTGEARRRGRKADVLESREAEGRRGATRFEEDARATIQLTKAADESTLAHEAAHVWRRALEAMAERGDANAIAERALLETEYGVEGHNWTREQEERFARDQLAYIKEGMLPTPELAKVFQGATDLLADIISQSPREELGQGARFAFDMMFSPPAPAVDGTKYYQKLQLAGSNQANKLTKGNIWRRIQAQTLSPMRIFDMLGGSGKKTYDMMLDSRESAWKRRAPIERADAEKAKKLKMGRNLARKIKVAGSNDWFTAEQVIGMLWAKDNPDSHDTLVYGNQIPDDVVEALVAQLTPEEVAWGKAMHDSDQRLWGPMAEAFEEATGQFAPPQVEDHFPIRIQDKAYESTSSEMADDVLARGGIRRAAVSKKWFTKRKEISPEHRQKMRLDATSLYFAQVVKTTHFIETWKTAKRLDRIYNDPAVRDQIAQTFGNDWNKAIESALNVFKNPSAFSTVHPGDRFANRMRKATTASGLIGNLTSLGYQLTGPLMYLGDTGPQYLLRSVAQFTKSPAKIWNKVMDNLPMIAEGSQDPVMSQLQNTDAKIRAQVADQINRWGFTPFDLLDKWTKVLGANAVYEKAQDAGLSEVDSWREAMRATLRTQPSGAEQDLPMMYHAQSLKLFLAFSRQLNQIWNMYSSDLPLDVRRGNLKRAAGDLMAIATTGFLIGMMQNKDLPDEPEEAAKWMAEQFLASVPIIGREVTPLLLGDGFYGSGVELVPGVRRMVQSGKKVFTKSGRERMDAAIRTVIEASRFSGMPAVMANRIYNAIKNEDPWELIGGPPDEK